MAEPIRKLSWKQEAKVGAGLAAAGCVAYVLFCLFLFACLCLFALFILSA